jgi:TonB family protein
MRLSLLFISLALLRPSLLQEESQPVIYLKHLESPVRYPPLARQVQFQGTVIVKFTIETDGTARSAEALTQEQDPEANAHSLLREETLKAVREWTFGCVYCSTNATYEKTIKFVYRLEGEAISYDDTKVVMDLPDQITITVSPALCDHCPRKKTSSGGTT